MISFSEALRFWLKLGFISFGGPTGQIDKIGVMPVIGACALLGLAATFIP